MACYLFNSCIIYDDEMRTITRNTPEPVKINLGSTANRCLQVLIEEQGNVVFKKTMLHEIWGKFGTEVVESSMWQVISQLRKTFEQARLDSHLIINVPRIGYKLSNALLIQKLPEQNLAAAVAALAMETTTLPVLPLSANPGKIRRNLALIACTLLLLLVTWISLAARAPQPGTDINFDFSHHIDDKAVWVPQATEETVPVISVENSVIRKIATMKNLVDTQHVYISPDPDPSTTHYYFCKGLMDGNKDGCISVIYVSGNI
ncbi:winged helix-turn-helix domain-containing protein [Buttiauxella gaviniae]|uniref:winged helix-turn-helix domain-containing protein n=1 Tax=Buttiauxella gaviniae TaxID=82990 RepID=UPI0039767AC0